MKKTLSARALLFIFSIILIMFALINHQWGWDQRIGYFCLFTGFTLVTYLEYFSYESIVPGVIYAIWTVLMTWGVYELLMNVFLTEFGSYIRIGFALFVHHWLAKGIKVVINKKRG